MQKKNPKTSSKRSAKPTKTAKSKKVTPIQYVHIDQFISRKSLDPSIAIGFREYMRGRTYLHRYEDFEKAYQEFLNRKV